MVVSRLLLAGLAFLAVCLPTAVIAQSCDLFLPQGQGAVVTYESYDRKDQFEGTMVYTITAVSGSKKTVKAVFTDAKGKQGMVNEFTLDCTSDELRIDMRNYMPASSQSEEYSFRGEAAYLTFASDLAIGATLPDGSMHLEVYRNDDKFNDTDLSITERTVAGQEQLTVPAGTFTTWLITSKSEIKTKITGLVAPVIPIRFQSKDYFAPGTGLIRSESYNPKGKLLGYTVLKSVAG